MPQRNKILTLLILICIMPLMIRAQQRRQLLSHPWIKTGTENLSASPVSPDTFYYRYTFDNRSVKISSYPAWKYWEFTWTYKEPFLAVGFQTYILEELTDSTMVWYVPDFLRFRFISASSFRKQQQPDTTTRFNGHTVYVANSYLIPRHKDNIYR